MAFQALKTPQLACETWILPVGSSNPTGSSPAESDVSANVFEILPRPWTLDQASQRLPEGAYTTFRTYHHRYAFHLEEHFQRLENSSRLAGFPVIVNYDRVRRGISEAIHNYPAENTRIRLLVDLTRHPGDIYISIEPLFVPSQEQYEKGVRVVTVQLARENPQAKLTRFISSAAKAREKLPVGVVEGIMLAEDGSFLEGLSSNFFAVVDGMIYTAGSSVLSGITRGLVIQEARQAGIPVKLDPAHYSELGEISEAFITSSSRAVLPVVQIDNTRVGNGQPGPTARLLLERYQERIQHEIEPILPDSA